MSDCRCVIVLALRCFAFPSTFCIAVSALVVGKGVRAYFAFFVIARFFFIFGQIVIVKHFRFVCFGGVVFHRFIAHNQLLLVVVNGAFASVGVCRAAHRLV